MKKILVPTDFSKYADYALEFAYCMASIFEAEVYIFHNKTSGHKIWQQRVDRSNSINENHETYKLLTDLTDTFSSNENSSLVEVIHKSGNLLKNVNEIIASKDIDFIVMGSHGASGKRETFLGSNTQKVVHSVNVPVFVVKNSVKDYRIDKVIFASNFAPSEIKALTYALDFLKPFKPAIHLVEVNTPGFFTQPYALAKSLMDDFKNLCSGFECKTHFYKGNSVEAGVRHITKKLDADLIIISNQNRHPLKRVFKGSNVEYLVNHSEVPVLSIDFKNK